MIHLGAAWISWFSCKWDEDFKGSSSLAISSKYASWSLDFCTMVFSTGLLKKDWSLVFSMAAFCQAILSWEPEKSLVEFDWSSLSSLECSSAWTAWTPLVLPLLKFPAPWEEYCENYALRLHIWQDSTHMTFLGVALWPCWFQNMMRERWKIYLNAANRADRCETLSHFLRDIMLN